MKTVRLKHISVLVPYVAVLVGLYIFSNAWLTLGMYHFGITMFLIAHNRSIVLTKVCRGWKSTYAAAAVVMSAMVFPIVFLLWPNMQLENVPLHLALPNVGLQGTSWVVFMIYFSTVHPVLEELYWRGYLQSDHKYISWTDCAFAGYHLLVLAKFMKAPWLLIAFIALTFVAGLWRYIAARLDGLIVPLLSHIVADASIVAVTCVLIRQ